MEPVSSPKGSRSEWNSCRAAAPAGRMSYLRTTQAEIGWRGTIAQRSRFRRHLTNTWAAQHEALMQFFRSAHAVRAVRKPFVMLAPARDEP